jgi:hypothetical protein
VVVWKLVTPLDTYEGTVYALQGWVLLFIAPSIKMIVQVELN